jgi:hypothetical protein
MVVTEVPSRLTKEKSEFVQSDENHKNRIAESFFSRTAVLKVRCELKIYVFDE